MDKRHTTRIPKGCKWPVNHDFAAEQSCAWRCRPAHVLAVAADHVLIRLAETGAEIIVVAANVTRAGRPA